MSTLSRCRHLGFLRLTAANRFPSSGRTKPFSCSPTVRPLVMISLIGGPLALVAGIGVLLGAWDTTSGLPVALTAPEAIWEFSLSVWLLVRGFRPSPILTGPPVAPGQAS